jgi:putative ATPase
LCSASLESSKRTTFSFKRPEVEILQPAARVRLERTDPDGLARFDAKVAAFDRVVSSTEPVPLHIRNAPTGLMANLGYGRGYQYAHDAPEALVSQEHLPDALRGRVYYRPTDRGAEKELAERLRAWRQWRDAQRGA